MKVSKPLIIATALVSGSLIMGGVALATSSSNSNNNLVDQIANRFHLNRSDVQQVFDQHKTQAMANRDHHYEQMLDNAVTNGKLTSAQKDKILAKHKAVLTELQNDRTNNQNTTPAQRRAELQKLRDEI